MNIELPEFMFFVKLVTKNLGLHLTVIKILIK